MFIVRVTFIFALFLSFTIFGIINTIEVRLHVARPSQTILPQHGCINDSTPINWPNIFAALLSLIDHVVVRFKAAYAFHTH